VAQNFEFALLMSWDEYIFFIDVQNSSV
jgi:hypothetical protein